MLLKKITKRQFFTLALFLIAFFLVRLPFLGADVINPDGVNWHNRSEQFIVGLKTGQFEKTYQHYHPGVTLTWLVGVPVEIIKQTSSQNQLYTSENYLMFHTVVKYVLVIVHAVLSLVILYFLNVLFQLRKDRLSAWSFEVSLLIVSLFSLEPFFVGNSRLVHLDVLLSLLLFLALLVLYLALESSKKFYFMLSGVFLALSFLTKSIGVGGLVFALGIVVLHGFLNKVSIKNLLTRVSILLLSFVTTMLVLFPALWVDFIGTLYNIFDEADRIGIRSGHGQIFFEDYSRDPGFLFYFVILLMKLSFVTIMGNVFLLIFSLIKHLEINLKSYSLELFLFVFYFGYLLVMMYPSKKLDRYMLPLFPPMALFAILGYYKAYDYFQNKISIRTYFAVLVSAVLLFLVVPLATFYPYYFTYTSPIFGSPKTANSIVGQKPFGVGIPELKDFLDANYGENLELGFIDTKPMKTIYGNSRVHDIRVEGTRTYDYLILAINEEFPEKVYEGEYSFEKDSSIFINGLEYWRIYVKSQ